MITCVVGTNRPNSNSRRVADELRRVYSRLGQSIQLLDLTHMPPEMALPSAYGAQKPEGFEPLASKIVGASGVVFVVAEYNGSFPGILKLFLDHLPYPDSFERRPICFVGLSAGNWGGLRAVEQLQAVVGYRNAHVYPERVFIPQCNGVFDAEARIRSDELLGRLERQARGFLAFVNALTASRPADD